jgi:hypothetical protein
MDTRPFSVLSLSNEMTEAQISCVQKLVVLDYLSKPYNVYDALLVDALENFQAGRVDLNNDNIEDLIIKFSSSMWCGAKNCTTKIFVMKAEECAGRKIYDGSTAGEIRVFKNSSGFADIEFSGGGYPYIKEQPLYSYDNNTKRYECQNCEVIQRQVTRKEFKQ